MYAHQAILLAIGISIINGFTCSLSTRAHHDDYLLGILGAIVTEEFILATGTLRNGSHILLHDSGNSIVIAVAALAMREESLGILGHTLCLRTLRSESTCTEFAHGLHIYEVTYIILLDEFHLLILMRGAESVEEIDEGNACLDSRQMSHGAQVHNLLHRTLGQHSKTSLSTSHHIAVVTKDTQRMSGNGTCRHMEHAGKQLASNLVHVGDHQQQTLTGSEGGSQGTCLQ